MFDRKLLTKLSRCAWKVLHLYLTQAVPYDDATPGAAIAVQSFGDFQNFNPHLHIIATDGCFYGNGAFMVCPPPITGELEELFRYEVFKMLKAEGKINDAVIENMVNWRHSGFNVYCGSAIWPHNEEGLKNLARYIIRASFSQERMTYIPAHDASDGVARVIYESKDGTRSKTLRYSGIWACGKPSTMIRLPQMLRISRSSPTMTPIPSFPPSITGSNNV